MIVHVSQIATVSHFWLVLDAIASLASGVKVITLPIFKYFMGIARHLCMERDWFMERHWGVERCQGMER